MINKNDILELLIFTQSKDNFENINDVRSITINALFKQIENLNIAVILSDKLSNLEFLKSEISQSIENNDIKNIIYNYEGFIKDAFFIKSFILIENHINQIAEFYEQTNNKIKTDSIVITFKNLINPNKCNLFTNLTENEIELFKFYCYLRNTIHKMGYQTKENKSIRIKDNSSMINKNEVTFELKENVGNDLNTNSLLLLHEQVIKLMLKINELIPKEDFIEHILVKDGYNG